MKIFLDNHILDWTINGSVGCYNEENIKECYEHLNHAESLINKHDDKYHIQDCIRNLKNIVNKRIKQIERVYNFKSFYPNKHILEIYKELGIVKGFVIRKLFIIRNDIEHNDLEYQDKEQCHDLLDTVWYFLKSTDNLIYISDICNHIFEDINRNDIWLDIEFEEPKFELVKIRGKVPNELLYEKDNGNSIEITCTIKDKEKNITYIEGNLVLNTDIKIKLAKKFFIDKILN